LPDGPADDVYDSAKEIDPELPIVVITGYPDSEMLESHPGQGPVTVLKKPLKSEQLKQTSASRAQGSDQAGGLGCSPRCFFRSRLTPARDSSLVLPSYRRG
jgi:FixJ family two-component response regulator